MPKVEPPFTVRLMERVSMGSDTLYLQLRETVLLRAGSDYIVDLRPETGTTIIADYDRSPSIVPLWVDPDGTLLPVLVGERATAKWTRGERNPELKWDPRPTTDVYGIGGGGGKAVWAPVEGLRWFRDTICFSLDAEGTEIKACTEIPNRRCSAGARGTVILRGKNLSPAIEVRCSANTRPMIIVQMPYVNFELAGIDGCRSAGAEYRVRLNGREPTEVTLSVTAMHESGQNRQTKIELTAGDVGPGGVASLPNPGSKSCSAQTPNLILRATDLAGDEQATLTITMTDPAQKCTAIPIVVKVAAITAKSRGFCLPPILSTQVTDGDTSGLE